MRLFLTLVTMAVGASLSSPPRKARSRRCLCAAPYSNDVALDDAVRRALHVLSASDERAKPKPGPRRLAAYDDVEATASSRRRRADEEEEESGEECSASTRPRSDVDFAELVLAWASPEEKAAEAEVDEAEPAARARNAIRLMVGELGRSRALDSPGLTVVELGAREADLAHAIADAIPEARVDAVVLVDRVAPDSAVRARDAHLGSLGRRVDRLTMDIEDLDLDKVEASSLVCVGKHICGPATDLALRAVGRSESSGLRFLSLAPCCYHLAAYDSYPNKRFLRRVGFDRGRADFDALAQATLRPNASTLGQDALDILDAGRVDFLRRRGYDARLVKYARSRHDAVGSLETNIILATRGS